MRSPPRFHDWWAHDEAEERAAFEGFIDWLVAWRRRDPSLHVYHYASYDESAVKRLMGKYATREAEVDDLLRGGVFVDLYAVVGQGFVIGTPSYSLKDIERLYLPPRTGPVLSAGGSVVEYQKWIDSGQPRRWEESPILQGIRNYNRVDCESTWTLRSWLLDRRKESGIEYARHPERSEGSTSPSPDTRDTEHLAARLVESGIARLASDPEAARLWARSTLPSQRGRMMLTKRAGRCVWVLLLLSCEQSMAQGTSPHGDLGHALIGCAVGGVDGAIGGVAIMMFTCSNKSCSSLPLILGPAVGMAAGVALGASNSHRTNGAWLYREVGAGACALVDLVGYGALDTRLGGANGGIFGTMVAGCFLIGSVVGAIGSGSGASREADPKTVRLAGPERSGQVLIAHRTA